MAECSKCKKEVGYLTARLYRLKGKIHCIDCYNKVMAEEKEKEKREKHIKDANQAVLIEYDNKGRELIISLINTWKPRNCKRETDYTKSLKKFLDKELTPIEIYVGEESGLGSSRLDLVVGKKKPSTGVYSDFAIELKYNLQKSDKFDRLKGQIHTYVSAKFKHIIILLIGKTEPKFETELNNYNKEMLDHYTSSYRYSSLRLDTIDVIKKK